MKNFSTALSGFFATVKWCLVLSWLSSKLYTTVRIAADIVTPLLALLWLLWVSTLQYSQSMQSNQKEKYEV